MCNSLNNCFAFSKCRPVLFRVPYTQGCEVKRCDFYKATNEYGAFHVLYHIVWHFVIEISLHWRHNDHDGIWNHQPHGCLLNHLFRRRSKKHQSSASLALVRGIHRDRWIPRTKGQLRGKCFHLMTSSCNATRSKYDTKAGHCVLFRTNKSYFIAREGLSAIILRHGNEIASYREGIKIHNLIIPHFICVEVILGVLYRILSVVIDINRMINCSMI